MNRRTDKCSVLSHLLSMCGKEENISVMYVAWKEPGGMQASSVVPGRHLEWKSGLASFYLIPWAEKERRERQTAELILPPFG